MEGWRLPAGMDPRLTAARADLAAEALRGVVEAGSFVVPWRARVAVGIAPLRSAPGARGLAAELAFGAEVDVLEVAPGGFAWVQALRDGYVGYVPAGMLGAPGPAPTHRVAAALSHLYGHAGTPDLKTAPLHPLPMNARLAGRIEGAWLVTEDARAVPAAHVAPLDAPAPDWVAEAEGFLGAPYLWGGNSALGIDCSGLMQEALAAAGRPFPRDSDLQAGEGAPAPEGDLRRGDLVFWRGHVGVMLDPATLLHANAHHMAVAREPLAEARARIGATAAGAPTAFRRLTGA